MGEAATPGFSDEFGSSQERGPELLLRAPESQTLRVMTEFLGGMIVPLGRGLLAIQLFVGCSCEEKLKVAVDTSRPPAPLVVKGSLGVAGVVIHPIVGSTNASPVALVLSEDPQLCSTIVKKLGNQAHILCSELPASQIGVSLKKALQSMKQMYPRHTGKPPVLLVAGSRRSEVAWRLMLAEPGFFAHSYIEGLDASVLTSTTLAALHQGHARTLVIQGAETKRLKLLTKIAVRRGLALHTVGSSRSARMTAIDLLKDSDPRLSHQ